MAVVPLWTLPKMRKTRQRPGRENTRGDASGLRWIGSLVVGPPYEIACEYRPRVPVFRWD